MSRFTHSSFCRDCGLLAISPTGHVCVPLPGTLSEPPHSVFDPYLYSKLSLQAQLKELQSRLESIAQLARVALDESGKNPVPHSDPPCLGCIHGDVWENLKQILKEAEQQKETAK